MTKLGGRLSLSKRRVLLILPIWVAVSLWLWLWWMNPDRVSHGLLYIPLTLAMLYEYTVLPTVFMSFMLKAKQPRKRRTLENKKVAVITLCVPSQESIDIVEKQLQAMVSIKYPHDSWILDEGNSKEVKRLARKYGVKHFSRKGIAKYNQPIPPFKAKTKAGNVNAWLEKVKRYNYEYFVQLDIDHIPKPNYLHKTLGQFRDEKIAWVQAPSVYKNLNHWTSRGAAELELVFQGPLQMGFYGNCETPFIIGSHCSYRMSAVREIGGFQPTRAEDHLDTVALASKGWKGVFLPEIIAEGDGPETLNTYFAQHFAWAYSMFQVLIHHSPKLFKSMSLKRQLQFLFAQTWYPLWSLSYMVMFLTPIIALLIGHGVIAAKGYDFLIHFLPMFSITFLIWWAARPIMQPSNLQLSWRGVLLHGARWPIIIRAITSAAFRVKKPYMITPKGKFAKTAPTIKLYLPFLVLGFSSIIAVTFATFKHEYHATVNQIFFAFINVVFALLICTVDLELRMKQAKDTLQSFRRYWLRPIAAVMSLVLISAILFSFVIMKNSVIHAAIVPRQTVQKINLKALPPEKLTIKQIMEQLSDNTYKTDESVPTLGIYEPTRKLYTGQSYIRHSFIDWRDDRQLAEQLLITKRVGAVPLITIEPQGVNDGHVLLEGIAAGQYDQQLKELVDIMSATNQPVYVRFAHEMELADLYPWGDQSPANYIAAYRHFVDLARLEPDNNIKWIWSPAGNFGAEAYYPGDDVVDIIGTTILYDRYWYYNYHPSFYELSSLRQWLQGFDKPVWVVEFGAGKADTEFQRELIQEAINNFRNYGYSALVYLNISDSNILQPDYRVADISIFGKQFKPVPILVHEASTEEHDSTQKRKAIEQNVASKLSSKEQEPAMNIDKLSIGTPPTIAVSSSRVIQDKKVETKKKDVKKEQHKQTPRTTRPHVKKAAAISYDYPQKLSLDLNWGFPLSTQHVNSGHIQKPKKVTEHRSFIKTIESKLKRFANQVKPKKTANKPTLSNKTDHLDSIFQNIKTMDF